MSEQQHNGSESKSQIDAIEAAVKAGKHVEVKPNGDVVIGIPPETGALVPPHPQMYDITKDEMRAVAQEDFDLVARAAEEGQLRNLLIRKLLNMDRDKLRQVRKLFDDGVTGRPNAQG